MKRYSCTTCKKEILYSGALPAEYPFCGERCRMVDLGRWFRGEYAIERDANDGDFDADATKQLPDSRSARDL